MCSQYLRLNNSPLERASKATRSLTNIRVRFPLLQPLLLNPCWVKPGHGAVTRFGSNGRGCLAFSRTHGRAVPARYTRLSIGVAMPVGVIQKVQYSASTTSSFSKTTPGGGSKTSPVPRSAPFFFPNPQILMTVVLSVLSFRFLNRHVNARPNEWDEGVLEWWAICRLSLMLLVGVRVELGCQGCPSLPFIPHFSSAATQDSRKRPPWRTRRTPDPPLALTLPHAPPFDIDLCALFTPRAITRVA